MQLDSRLAVDSAPRHEIITRSESGSIHFKWTWTRVWPPAAVAFAFPPRIRVASAAVLLLASSGDKVGARLNRWWKSNYEFACLPLPQHTLRRPSAARSTAVHVRGSYIRWLSSRPIRSLRLPCRVSNTILLETVPPTLIVLLLFHYCRVSNIVPNLARKLKLSLSLSLAFC